MESNVKRLGYAIELVGELDGGRIKYVTTTDGAITTNPDEALVFNSRNSISIKSTISKVMSRFPTSWLRLAVVQSKTSIVITTVPYRCQEEDD